jgi:hypothetical protein
MSSEAKEVVKIYLNLRLFCNRASTGIFQKGQEDKGANSTPRSPLWGHSQSLREVPRKDPPTSFAGDQFPQDGEIQLHGQKSFRPI